MNKKTRLATWIKLGIKSIRSLDCEHSSSIYALASSYLDRPKSWLLSHPHLLLSEKDEEYLNSHLARLKSGEPLAYITGLRSFFGLDFIVTPEVLIPRPETELLVEQAILSSQDLDYPLSIADVGTGSGCVAISLTKSIPRVQLIATDISFQALLIAKMNIQLHKTKNFISLVQANLLEGIDKKFHVICGNLPYIPSKKLKNLSVVNYEPRISLDGGKNGLYFICQLLKDIQKKLHDGGKLILEIESGQRSDILKICEKYLPSASCRIIEDLAGLPRVAVIKFNS